MLSAVLQAQTFSYELDRATAAGLTVVTQQHESFAAQLDAVTSHERTKISSRGRALLRTIAPLVVIFRNTGDTAIDSIVLKYRYQFDSDGSIHEGTVSLAKNDKNPGQFAPGQTLILYPGASALGDGFTAVNEGLISDLPELLARCRSVTVRLDSIEFADGRRIAAGIHLDDGLFGYDVPLLASSYCQSAGGITYDPTACFKSAFGFTASPQVAIYGQCTNGMWISAQESVTSTCTTFPVNASVFAFGIPGFQFIKLPGSVNVLGSIVGGVFPVFGESSKDCWGVPSSTGTIQSKC